MPTAEIVIEPATISIAVFGALTWLLGISFTLGRYSERQKHLENAQKEYQEQQRLAQVKTDQTIAKIFDKLDELAKSVPHVCSQTEKIVRLEQIAKDKERRLEDLEHWRGEAGFHAQRMTEEGGK